MSKFTERLPYEALERPAAPAAAEAPLAQPMTAAAAAVVEARQVDGAPSEPLQLATETTGAPEGPSRTTIREFQKHAIARAAICGLPIPDIAAMVRHTPATIRRLLDTDSEIERLMEHYSGQVIRAAVGHRFEMMERLERCYAAIDAGLTAGELKVRMDTAKYVISQVVTGPASQVNVNLGVSGIQAVDPVEQDIVREAIKEIGSQLREVVQQAANTKFQDHLVKHDQMPGPGDVRGLESLTDSGAHPEIEFPRSLREASPGSSNGRSRTPQQ